MLVSPGEWSIKPDNKTGPTRISITRMSDGSGMAIEIAQGDGAVKLSVREAREVLQDLLSAVIALMPRR